MSELLILNCMNCHSDFKVQCPDCGVLQRASEPSMPKLEQVTSCDLCEADFPPFSKDATHEIVVRRYVGGHGHLIDFAYHPACFQQYLKQQLLLDTLLTEPKKERN